MGDGIRVKELYGGYEEWLLLCPTNLVDSDIGGHHVE
jgi:hypothetical protein